MDGLREHFKKHGTIHGMWIVTILVLILAALLIRLPNGERVNEYISFASSLASLLLAMVAIFYAFISNQDVSKSAYLVQNSAAQIQNLADSLSSSAAIIGDKADHITKDLQDIRPTVEQIHEKISVSPAVTSTEITSEDADSAGRSGSIFKSNPTVGSALALYAIAKAKKENISNIDPTAMMSGNEVWQHYTMGALGAIETTQPCGIDLKLVKVAGDDTVNSYYNIIHVPQEVIDTVLEFVTEEKYPAQKHFLEKIDTYLKNAG